MKKAKRAENLYPLSLSSDAAQESRAQACFHQGTNEAAYEYFGAHPLEDGFVFRVWAPHADFVSVCGDFNCWNTELFPMTRISRSGVWEVRVSEESLGEGSLYKFYLRNGEKEMFKADPYGICTEKPSGTASVICDLDGYTWRDEGWMKYRKGKFCRAAAGNQPINIYELHLGTWKRHGDGSFYSYADAAADLIPYIKQMGYTHVELLRGNAVSGYYAPDPQFGSPADFMAFVDAMHEAGIGVIMDWRLACFSKDEHGLSSFDGQPLYEPEDPTRCDAPEVESSFFDLGRAEIRSFLISSAVFWARKYHIDGLRAASVASMLYLDYDKSPGEWTPNMYGDSRNLEAVSFLQKLNSRMAAECPDVMMIAEDFSAWKGVTGFDGGGLGFTLKWNSGWGNESLAYLREDPLYRHYHHEKLTFPMSYAFGESYILPVSHDRVSGENPSLMEQVPGKYEQRFANLRAYMTYMMTHPGKKLLFMGGEFGQFRAWNRHAPLEWFLLDYDMHGKTQLFTSELNHFYLANSPLWEKDDDGESFEWIDADNAEQSVYSYRRRDKKGRELIILLNFLPVKRENFLLSVPESGVYEEILNSDAIRYGGSGIENPGKLKTQRCDSGKCALRVDLPPMSGLIFRCLRRAARK